MKTWPLVALKFAVLASSPWWVVSCADRAGSSAGAVSSSYKIDPLEDFYLTQPVDVRGLSASAALEKLRLAYEDTCRQTGDKPLKLVFEVPPGQQPPLRVQLANRSLGDAIEAVGVAAKWEVERSGATYRFTVPREDGQVAKRGFDVPPDFVARLASPAPHQRDMTPREAFRKSGVDLDESTRLALKGTKLEVESRSAADMAAISGMVTAMVGRLPVQQKISTRVVEVPAASKVKIPAGGSLDSKAAARLLADLGKEPGVEWGVLPTFTMRVGEDVKLNFGKTKLQVKSGAVGLGHQLQTAFNYRPAGSNSRRTEARDSGPTMDGGSRLIVQTQPDGSRTVFLVETVFIDATGKPLRPSKQLPAAAVDVSPIVFR